MSWLDRLGRKVFWWQQVSYLLFFARSLLLMRLIAPGGYGAFALATALASWVSLARSFDFRAAVVAAKEAGPRLPATVFAAELSLCALNLLVGAILLPWFHARYGGAVAGAMMVLLLADAMDGASGAPLYLAERDLQFPFLTRARTLINAVGFVACVGLALAGWGVGALVADRVLGAALMAGVVWRRTGWKAALAWDGESLRYLLRFGGWLLAGAMVGKLLFGLDAMALGTFWGEEALGYYSRAMVWARLPLDVGVGFLAMMALAIYSSESRASGEAARRSYADLSGHVARISLAMAGLLAIGMHDAVPVLFGERWRPITPMFYALVPYAVARPLFQNAAQCLLSLHEQRYFVGAVVASTAVLGAGIALSVGRSPLWVAAANGAAMLLGYVLLERRVERRLAPRAWASAATPAALFAAAMLALAACRRLGPEGAAGLALAAALAAAYALAAWWEWRRWGSLQSSKAAA